MFIEKLKIIAVGVNDKTDVLRKLPAEIYTADDAAGALKILRKQITHMLVSRWNLPDRPDGRLIEKYINAGTGKPTAAFIEPKAPEQETQARILGVSLILPDDTDEDLIYDKTAMLIGDRFGIDIFKQEYEKLVAEYLETVETTTTSSYYSSNNGFNRQSVIGG